MKDTTSVEVEMWEFIHPGTKLGRDVKHEARVVDEHLDWALDVDVHEYQSNFAQGYRC
jgi:hypothetical protein